MEYLDLSLPSPEENLACDEALLDLAEEGLSGEALRFWESSTYFVVVGYSNKITREVKVDSCGSDNIPIFRRISGGGTILQGPGCLNYSLILDTLTRQECKTIPATNQYVMSRLAASLGALSEKNISLQGDTDLVFSNSLAEQNAFLIRKFSGNAQRRRKRFFLFHGTFLIGMELKKIENYLAFPSRTPEYRKGREHLEFISNLKMDREQLKITLRSDWQATAELSHKNALDEKIRKLLPQYRSKIWNEKFK